MGHLRRCSSACLSPAAQHRRWPSPRGARTRTPLARKSPTPAPPGTPPRVRWPARPASPCSAPTPGSTGPRDGMTSRARTARRRTWARGLWRGPALSPSCTPVRCSSLVPPGRVCLGLRGVGWLGSRWAGAAARTSAWERWRRRSCPRAALCPVECPVRLRMLMYSPLRICATRSRSRLSARPGTRPMERLLAIIPSCASASQTASSPRTISASRCPAVSPPLPRRPPRRRPPPCSSDKRLSTSAPKATPPTASPAVGSPATPWTRPLVPARPP
mmetsp:Transcript_2761/g.5913  ORF Transcript_2761/g.5913 Transcript_2761/m.5913 type:complete len:274 (+) Transcript_2761:1603-2424(+)